jgi:hypothetical protein
LKLWRRVVGALIGSHACFGRAGARDGEESEPQQSEALGMFHRRTS